MNIKKVIQSIVVLAVFGAFSIDLHAGTFSWNANSGLLPNQVDPTMLLTDTAIPENPVLAGGVLALQTSPDSELMYYEQTSPNLSIPNMLQIDASVRYASGSTSSPTYTHIMLAFNTETSVGGRVLIGLDEIFSWENDQRREAATVDTDSTFHDYRIVTNGTSLGSPFSVFQDSVLLFSDTLVAQFGSERILFGDPTLMAQGTSVWRSFSHNAAVGPVVPIPAAFWLFGSGIAGLFGFKIRRNFADPGKSKG